MENGKFNAFFPIPLTIFRVNISSLKRNLLKQIIFLLTFLGFSWVAQAQQAQIPPYKKFPTIPPFELTTLEKTVLTKKNLTARPTIIMFFSPTCNHCQEQVKDFKKYYDQLKEYQFVMACYTKPEELSTFVQDYELSGYNNFLMGIDTKYILPPFYDIKSLPFIALYDKKGNLLTTKEGNMKVDEMLKVLSK